MKEILILDERARAREIKKGRELCRDVEIFSFCVLIKSSSKI